MDLADPTQAVEVGTAGDVAELAALRSLGYVDPAVEP
jgi:hypothetical protein